MKKGLLLLSLSFALLAKSPTTVHTVCDECGNTLMWQDIRANKELLFSWEEAKEYCEDLRFHGYEDWWLPEESQLALLIDMKRKKGKRIRKEFRYFKPAPYWTATTYAFNAPHAWYIDFDTGYSRSEIKDKKFFVRCFRRVASKEARK